MLFSIIACVLAIVVPAGVGLLQWHNMVRQWESIKSNVETALNASSTSWRSLESQLHALQQQVNTSTPAVLRAEVEGLAAALDADRAAARRQFGKLWGTLGAEGLNGEAKPAQSTLPRLPGWQG